MDTPARAYPATAVAVPDTAHFRVERRRERAHTDPDAALQLLITY